MAHAHLAVPCSRMGNLLHFFSGSVQHVPNHFHHSSYHPARTIHYQMGEEDGFKNRQLDFENKHILDQVASSPLQTADNIILDLTIEVTMSPID